MIRSMEYKEEEVMLKRSIEEMKKSWKNMKEKRMDIRKRMERNEEKWKEIIL
jgi:predicted RNase H-like nuclease (RuvC/YqgF family)